MTRKNKYRQISNRHHHVPDFYLSAWTGEDGELCVVKNIRNKIVYDRHPPKHTGFEYHLYSYSDNYSGEDKSEIETKFFSRLDSEGAKIVAKMMAGEDLIHKDRIIWAQFLAGLHVRTPTNVKKIKAMTKNALSQELAEGQSDYLKHKKDNDPATFKEWVNKNRPGLFENIGVKQIPKIASSPNVLQDILKFSWYTADLESAAKPLLTSDRPLIMTGGLHYDDCIIVLPLSPRYAFFAFRPQTKAQNTLMTTSPRHLVMALNRTIVSQAEKYVYCYASTDAPSLFYKKNLKLFSEESSDIIDG